MSPFPFCPGASAPVRAGDGRYLLLVSCCNFCCRAAIAACMVWLTSAGMIRKRPAKCHLDNVRVALKEARMLYPVHTI